jgi:dynein heavy chain
MRISTIYSAEKEDVELRENIYPTGNVEEWMLLIEKTMKESLRQIIRDSLEDYKKVSDLRAYYLIVYGYEN